MVALSSLALRGALDFLDAQATWKGQHDSGNLRDQLGDEWREALLSLTALISSLPALGLVVVPGCPC
jgi:hypothetical protein